MSQDEGLDVSFEDNANVEETCVDDGEIYEDVVSTQDLRKNLVMTFDNAYAPKTKLPNSNTEKAKKMQQVNNSLQNSKSIPKTKTRPPIAPVLKNRTNVKRSHDVIKKESNDDMKPLLSVYLRVRPPVAPGKNGVHALTNTIEFIPDSEDATKFISIRTYPPVSSNAAKSFRSDNKKKTGSSQNVNQYSNDIASGVAFDDNSANVDLASGVKEFDFNHVFKPETRQNEVYDNVAAPLVDGLFPQRLNNQEHRDFILNTEKHQVDEDSPLRKKVKGADGNTLSTAKQYSKGAGKSALLFAYGITNAGKTHTIVGDTSSKKEKGIPGDYDLNPEAGILPRALEHILSKIKLAEKNDEANEYQMQMSYLEIYNENIYDLLPPPAQHQQQSGYDSTSSATSATRRVTRSRAATALRLREDRSGHIFVKGLSKHPVASANQGIQLADMAKEKRHTSSNNINDASSRSHCVCQLELTVMPKNYVDEDDRSTSSNPSSLRMNNSTSLWIVDLAGIERSKRTGMMYRSARQKEAAVINSSLMKLMRCLQTMCNNQKPSTTNMKLNGVVPFRESKLTHLFMNHLTGASAAQTSMIVNINPAAVDFDETQHVLSYAVVARTVKISAQDYLSKFNAISRVPNDNGIIESAPVRVSNESENISLQESEASPKKVTKLVERLSPRALLKKKRERKAASKQKETKLRSTRSARTDEGTMKIDLKTRQKVDLESTKSKNKRGNEELRNVLQELQEENTHLRDQIEMSKDDQIRREYELRQEWAQEMESEIRNIRDHYDSIIRKNKVTSNPTPLKTIKALQTERQEQFLKELMDKNDECEDEMVRMSERHAEEIKNICIKHENMLKSKEQEIDEKQKEHEESLHRYGQELKQLKEDLTKSRLECVELRREHDDLLAFMENKTIDDVQNDGLADSDDDMENVDEENNMEEQTNRVKLGRLPRNRCSEVACGDVSLPTPNSSSKKKSKYTLRTKSNMNRTPLSLVSGNN